MSYIVTVNKSERTIKVTFDGPSEENLRLIRAIYISEGKPNVGRLMCDYLRKELKPLS